MRERRPPHHPLLPVHVRELVLFFKTFYYARDAAQSLTFTCAEHHERQEFIRMSRCCCHGITGFWGFHIAFHVYAFGFGVIIGLGSDYWVCLCWMVVLFPYYLIPLSFGLNDQGFWCLAGLQVQ